MSAAAGLVLHTLVSLALIAFAYQATAQPWVAAAVPDAVADSLVRKWLLWTFVLASLAGAFVVTALPGDARARFIARHAALYLFVPLTLLFLRSSAGLLAG